MYIESNYKLELNPLRVCIATYLANKVDFDNLNAVKLNKHEKVNGNSFVNVHIIGDKDLVQRSQHLCPYDCSEVMCLNMPHEESVMI